MEQTDLPPFDTSPHPKQSHRFQTGHRIIKSAKTLFVLLYGSFLIIVRVFLF